MASETTTSGGIGFVGLLTILFIGLKLTGYIDWSWVWVFVPLWGPFGLVLFIVAVASIGIMIFKIFQAALKRS